MSCVKREVEKIKKGRIFDISYNQMVILDAIDKSKTKPQESLSQHLFMFFYIY